MKEKLINSLNSVQKIATSSKLMRAVNNPYKYVNAVVLRKLQSNRTTTEKVVQSSTFFGDDMFLKLPSGTDIYLTGGKSHDSEIRLAKFLINHLSNQDTFVDVGAHYGYFSLLAGKLVGTEGRVLSIEATPSTYEVLNKNCDTKSQIQSMNVAVSDVSEIMTFYEFPNLYSEYNSMDIKQFEDEPWFKDNPPKEIKIQGMPLVDFFQRQNIHPRLIKIDVEGAEFKVVKGLKEYLVHHSPIIVMEYLSKNRGNAPHIKAEELLVSLGYGAYVIDEDGKTVSIPSANHYLNESSIESDNVVFMRV